MKKTILLSLLHLVFITGFAQQAEPLKIAVFTPLYLDSAFDGTGNFRYNEKNYARFVNPGLDFYLGAQLALDSLAKRGAQLDVHILDSRSGGNVAQQLALPQLEGTDLIIAQSNAAETKLIAEAAQRMNIPFISATFPNDAGVGNNPYFVVLNSTLQTHAEGIYRFLQKYHSLDQVIFFRRPGGQEDQLKHYFTEFAKTTASVPVRIKFVDLPGNFSAQQLVQHLDSNRRNVCIAGSLDESFGMRLTQALSVVNDVYPVRVIGMPTWDNFNFSKVTDVEVVYSTPFYYARQNTLESQLAKEYAAKMTANPGDMFFRGYETVLRFALLLLDTKDDVASNLSRKGNTVFTQFNIQPILRSGSDMNLDYFENKHLYFVKIFGGVKNLIQ
ncbi:MAG TPA: hypothetical protein VFZ78_01840 [Flavisolibacter sp.]